MTSNDTLIARISQGLDRLRAQVVHVGMFDHHTVFRERRLRREEFLTGAGTAVFANVLPKWDAAEALVLPGPYGSESVAYDPDSLRPYPFEAAAAVMIADYSGPQQALMPRHVLAQQLARAAARGYEVLAAFEFEFIVLAENAESLRARGFANPAAFAPDNHCWSGRTAATHAGFVGELEELLRRADIALYSLGGELGPGCFEATLRHKHALRAADDAAFFRLFTQAFCRQQGRTASFVPYLGGGFPGIGGHITVSLRERDSGRNLFADAAADHGLSGAARAFLAGIIELVPEAFPLIAHTVNAYRRFAPGSWAPKTVSWAPNSYAAAIRSAAETEQTTRLECRLPGSDVNPYLGLALLVAAGLDGLDRGLVLTAPPLSGGGPAEIPPGVPRLPQDLCEATRRMRASGKAQALFGEAFIGHFATLCEAEDAALRRAVSPAEIQRYLELG